MFVQTREYPIWILLLHITGEKIQAEVSRPRSLDKSAQIDAWHERVIIDVPPPDAIADDVPRDEPGPDILPSVRMKI